MNALDGRAGSLPEVSIVMPCLNEADTLATCIDKAQRALREPASPARSSSPTTAAPTARRRSPAAHGARVVPVAGARLRQRADGRHRGGARPLRHHGRRRRQLRLPRGRRSSSTKLRAGLRPGAGLPAARRRRHACCPARCRPCTAGSAIRCSRPGAAGGSATPIHDVYCGMRGFTREAYRAPRPALHGHGVRHRDDHQGEPLPASASPRCRSRCTPTAARRTRRTCGRSATAGARCASSCCSARAGCSSCPGCSLLALGVARLRAGAARRDDRPASRSTCTRCSSPAWRSLGGQQAIVVRAVRQDLRDRRRAAAARPPHRALLRDRRRSSAGCHAGRRRHARRPRPAGRGRRCSGGSRTSVRSTTRTRCGWRFPAPR